MNCWTTKRFFPKSEALIIDQEGVCCSVPTNGVEVILYTRENERDPCSAELISGNHRAEIGLWFSGGELFDYDGAFWLPREVGEALNEAGYIVPQECFA